MKAQDVHTIQDLCEYLTANVPAERLEGQPIREKAEWFLACHQASSWFEMRVKDNASIVLYGMPPLKDNDEHANELIAIWFEDARFNADEDNADELMEEAVSEFEAAIKHHYGL